MSQDGVWLTFTIFQVTEPTCATEHPHHGMVRRDRVGGYGSWCSSVPKITRTENSSRLNASRYNDSPSMFIDRKSFFISASHDTFSVAPVSMSSPVEAATQSKTLSIA